MKAGFYETSCSNDETDLLSESHKLEDFLMFYLKNNEQDGSLNPLTDIDLAKHISEWEAVNFLCSKEVKL